MSGISDYVEAAVVNWALRGVAMPAAPAPYFALFTADPLDGTVPARECAHVGYARTPVAGMWSAPSGANNQSANTAMILCPVNGSGAVVHVTHAGIFDALAGGNLLFSGPLTPAKDIAPGDQLAFDVGTVVIQPDTV